jgi:hypothetical protein
MTAHLDGGHARLSAAPAAAGAFLSVGMAFASERRQIGPEAEEHMSQQEGRMDLFGRTIAIAERHVERLSEQVGTTPVPPELVREAPDSLAATPDQLSPRRRQPCAPAKPGFATWSRVPSRE